MKTDKITCLKRRFYEVICHDMIQRYLSYNIVRGGLHFSTSNRKMLLCERSHFTALNFPNPNWHISSSDFFAWIISFLVQKLPNSQNRITVGPIMVFHIIMSVWSGIRIQNFLGGRIKNRIWFKAKVINGNKNSSDIWHCYITAGWLYFVRRDGWYLSPARLPCKFHHKLMTAHFLFPFFWKKQRCEGGWINL